MPIRQHGILKDVYEKPVEERQGSSPVLSGASRRWVCIRFRISERGRRSGAKEGAEKVDSSGKR
jgi:hypothetical protein